MLGFPKRSWLDTTFVLPGDVYVVLKQLMMKRQQSATEVTAAALALQMALAKERQNGRRLVVYEPLFPDTGSFWLDLIAAKGWITYVPNYFDTKPTGSKGNHRLVVEMTPRQISAIDKFARAHGGRDAFLWNGVMLLAAIETDLIQLTDAFDEPGPMSMRGGESLRLLKARSYPTVGDLLPFDYRLAISRNWPRVRQTTVLSELE